MLELYVAHEETDDGTYGELKFYEDAEKQHPRPEGGNIEITIPARGDEIIAFERANGETWKFHDLTIHPRDPATGRPGTHDLLDLQWAVFDTSIFIVDKGSSPGQRRHFNYTISLLVSNPHHEPKRIYFDPEFVDIGGE